MSNTLTEIEVYIALYLCKKHNVCAYCGHKQSTPIHATNYHCDKCRYTFKSFKQYNKNMHKIEELYMKRWNSFRNAFVLYNIKDNLTNIHKKDFSVLITSPEILNEIRKDIHEQQEACKLTWQNLEEILNTINALNQKGTKQ